MLDDDNNDDASREFYARFTDLHTHTQNQLRFTRQRNKVACARPNENVFDNAN